MRFLRPTLVAALVLSVYGVVQAAVGADELSRVRPTTIQPSLPLTQLLSVIGFALTVAAYVLLARTVARGGGAPGAAALAGLVAGALAGLVTDVAQASAQTAYFRAILLAYGGIPDSLASLIAVAVLVIRPIVGAVSGALLAWLAALLWAPRRQSDPV